jgi:hypothetical protein
MGDWQTTQERLVQQGKDCSIRADTKRQSEHSHDGKAWRFAHLPQAQTNFMQDRMHLKPPQISASPSSYLVPDTMRTTAILRSVGAR